MFNIKEYKIMSQLIFESDEEYINQYNNYDSKKFTDIENMRVNSNNISDFLIKITDSNKYNEEQIFNNLKNCLYNRKAGVFSCGFNINEHLEKFDEFKNHQEFTICCWKSTIKFLNYNCDIIGIGNNINGNYMDKIDNIFSVLFTNDYWNNKIYNNKIKANCNIIKKEGLTFIKKKSKIKFKNSKIVVQNFYENDIYCFIIFLQFLGIKEFYLFGFYLAETFIDIQNYTFEKNLILYTSHHYDNSQWISTKEPGFFYDQINSYYIKKWINKNKIKLYNVSQKGIISNKILRIDFDNIFIKEKTFISPICKFEDFIVQIKKYFDPKYYYNTYLKQDNDKTIYNNKYNFKIILHDYITRGIIINNKINKNDNKIVVDINNFNKKLFCYIHIIYKLAIPYKLDYITYFYHCEISFNKKTGYSIYNNNDIFKKDLFIDIVKKDKIFNNHIDLIRKYNKQVFKEYIIENKIKFNFINNIFFNYLTYLIMYKNKEINLNFEDYRQLNDDLKDLTYENLIYHYYFQGYYENRKYTY